MAEKILVTVDEAAERLSIGRNKAYALVRDGELEHIRVGKAIKVTVAGLDKWVAQKLQDDEAPFQIS